MKLGIRASFDRLDELGQRFKGIDFPVELALPYRVGDFLSILICHFHQTAHHWKFAIDMV